MYMRLMKNAAAAVAAGTLIATLGIVGVASATYAPTPHLFVVAYPSKVLANGVSTAKVLVLYRNGTSSSGATVDFATTSVPSSANSCGSLPASGVTGTYGFLKVTYTSNSNVGFCTITANVGSVTASFTLVQIDPALAAAMTHYRTHLAASTHSLHADGTSTSTLTATVINGTTPVASDDVIFGTISLWHGACGVVAPAATATDSNGQVMATYTASTHTGLCLVWAREADTGSAGLTFLFQTP
jgi:hypothetical protein